MGADFGGGFLTVAGLNDVFIAKFNADGIHRWSQRFGNAGSEIGIGIAADPTGAVLLTGEFPSVIDFGGGPLTGLGAADIFVAKFADPAPVPTLITNFTATPRVAAIEMRWGVWSDEGLEGFWLYRRENDALLPAVIASGRYDTTTRSHIDSSVEPGERYHYELVIRTHDGDDIRSPVATATALTPGASLGQNRPNPFNPTTSIEYTLAKRAPAVISIYDAAGALVARLDQGFQDARTHRVEWNGRDGHGRAVGSGVYFYQLEGMQSLGSKKMVLMK